MKLAPLNATPMRRRFPSAPHGGTVAAIEFQPFHFVVTFVGQQQGALLSERYFLPLKLLAQRLTLALFGCPVIGDTHPSAMAKPACDARSCSEMASSNASSSVRPSASASLRAFSLMCVATTVGIGRPLLSFKASARAGAKLER